MDAPPDNEEPEDAPPLPPSAFGMEAEPWGCGVVAGMVFAAIMAPFLLLGAGGDPVPLAPGLAVSGIVALMFGLATAWLVRVRVRAWREGRRVRPALWAAFVALALFGWCAFGILGWPLTVLVMGVMGS